MAKFTQWLESIIQFYDDHIKKPFIAFRDVVLHLWVPIFSAILSLILFGKVDQTQDIYRSFIEDVEVSGFKIFLGTFLVFLLSVLVWYSGRLLSYRYSEEEKVAADAETTFQIWSSQAAHTSPFAIPDMLGDLLRSNTEEKANLTENLALLYIPRVLGLIPFAGLILGLHAIKGAEPKLILTLWLAICWFAEGGLFALFWLRRNLLKTQRQSSHPSLDDSLFSPLAENLLANLGLFCFGALTLPIVASQSGKASWGVIAFFIICVLMNLCLVLWNPVEKPLWQKKNLLSPIPLGLLVFISGLIFLNIAPTFWPNLLGSVSIAAISLCIVVVILSTIYNWGTEFGLPAVSGIVVLAIVASFLGWNNNHQIRLPKTEDLVVTVPTEDVATAFRDWFRSRPDLESFQGKEYPVYIVSAQGGGIYAAYHAATTLAKLHDTIPNFPNHVFAISGVSGGAVGSSVYGALAKEFGQNDGPCEQLTECAQKILGADFLSPQFSLALFPDLLQRFLPFPINAWDRSRGLDIAMEESWKTQIPNSDAFDHPLSTPFYQYWQPDGQSPALVLNTTNVETGQRLLLSPFRMKNVRTLADFNTKSQALALSTAAGLSARFPVISSAGWFKHQVNDETYRVRLIDGGYVDNSGLATTRDIIAALEEKQGNEDMSAMDKIQESSTGDEAIPRLISLAIVGPPAQRALSAESFQGLSEFGSPLLGLLNVYQNRSDRVIEQARFDFNRTALQSRSTQLKDYGFRGMYLDPTGLPLGWLLSEASQNKIDAQVPTFDDSLCRDKSEKEIVEAIAKPITSTETRLMNNACVAKSIQMELTGQLSSQSEPLE